MKKSLICILTALILTVGMILPVNALPVITGEVDGSYTVLADGVTFTKAAVEGSPYGKQKFNIIEFDLAERSLDLAILKTEYVAGKKTVANFVSAYNTEHQAEGKEIIAAVNGDLWMTEIHSNKNVTKSVLTVPRGMLMSDGVIYCSSQIPNEATYTTNGEGPVTFWAFGITEDYVPMLGQPIVNLTVKNDTQGLSTDTQAYNRLPAHDSLVIYDGNCNYTNYALDDAYEVVLTDIEGKFTCGGTVSGKVSAIYSANDDTSPTLDKTSIVLTARGDKIEKINGYNIGDVISIDVSISDASGRDNDWSKAVLAIGGHMPLVLDGVSTNPTGAGNYPSTIIGYKNDGKVVFIQNDGRQSNWSLGLNYNYMDDLVMQLGVNTCIHLDGGGSSTMIVGDELVNKPSDGSARSVINGIALVSCNEERAPQGEFTPKLPYRFNARYLSFENPNAANAISSGYGNTTSVTAVEGAVRLSASTDTIDPYQYYAVSSAFNTLNANQYKYIVMKYKTSQSVTTPSTELFLCAGATGGPTAGRSVRFEHGTAGEWNTQIIDLTDVSFWSGEIYGLRLDYFAGNAKQGEYMDIAYIAFAKTAEDAQAYVNGTADIPTVPAESAGIGVKAGSGLKKADGKLYGVSCNASVYDVVSGLTGSKLEFFKEDGTPIRNEKVCTGYTVSSYNTALEVVETLTIVVSGDVNGDSKVNNMDATVVLKYDAAISDLNETELLQADVNADGKVNNLDATAILKYDAGLIETFN